MSLSPVKHEVTLEVSADRAFELFTDRLGEWWPMTYTFSGSQFESARVEPRAGGRWFERTTSGDELDWGDVRAYERGRRLVLGFGIGPDRKPAPPERSSEVELRFVPEGARTRVLVEHRDFERHGDGAAATREGMASAQGWPVILAELRRAARRDR